MNCRHLLSFAPLALVGALAACGPGTNEEASPGAEQAVAAEGAGPNAQREIESPGAHAEQTGRFRSDSVEVPLAAKGDPNGGDKVEYMVRMAQGQTLAYDWSAQGADDFWHEFHGHTEDEVTFYEKAAGAEHQGALTAPFGGTHGWYFENRTANPVVVRLRLGGYYDLESSGG